MMDSTSHEDLVSKPWWYTIGLQRLRTGSLARCKDLDVEELWRTAWGWGEEPWTRPGSGGLLISTCFWWNHAKPWPQTDFPASICMPETSMKWIFKYLWHIVIIKYMSTRLAIQIHTHDVTSTSLNELAKGQLSLKRQTCHLRQLCWLVLAEYSSIFATPLTSQR